MAFTAHILTLFPELFPGPLAHSITGRALKEGKWDLKTYNIRDYGLGNHNAVDDTPYGGGAGMLMRPDVVAKSIREAKSHISHLTSHIPKTIYLTPTGVPLTHNIAKELGKSEHVILVCGHYEGIDQRVIDAEVDMELSIGDYVLTGGEIAVFPVLDAILRHVPNVLGAAGSLHEESFDIQGKNLLEYPHYTRPAVWEGREVPEVLTQGNHAKIEAWRLEQAKLRTKKRQKEK